MRVGLIGCGNIGTTLCESIAEGGIPVDIVAITDLIPERAAELVRTFGLRAETGTIEETVKCADYAVECAAPDAVESVLQAAMLHGKDCLIISVGGLLEADDLLEEARSCGVTVDIPSGAICGLDGLHAARESGLESVTLTTRKPPAAFTNVPWLEERGLDMSRLLESVVVFEGTAREACRAFPKNINVAATLSLAGVGPERTRVRIIADPGATCNIHEIEVLGAFGRLLTRTENRPSTRNPGSSSLASWSVISELRAAAMRFESEQVGLMRCVAQ